MKGKSITMKQFALIPIFLLSFADPVHGFYDECQTLVKDGLTWLNCSDTLIPKFPALNDIPKSVTAIDLSFNRILELHRINSTCGSFRRCDGCLKVLDLRNNEIETIEKDAFQSLLCLQNLDLSYNRITSKILNEETFQGLHSLKSLSLKGNPLGILPDYVFLFTELVDIERIDASDCEITTVEKAALSDLSFLEYLNLSGNKLSSLDREVFEQLKFLDILDLSRNKFVKIDQNTFEPLLQLRILFLDGNLLETIHPKAFDRLGFLKSLSLANNRLKQIPFLALTLLDNLQYLNFSGNPAETIHPSPDLDMKVPITTLTINNMERLENIDYKAFHVFSKLQYVYITNNRYLKTIAHDVFASSYLSVVHLNNNALIRLPEDLLPWADLEELVLNNNRWRCDCSLKWMLENSDFNHSIICNYPDKYKGLDLMTLNPSDLRCPRSLLSIFIGFVCAIIALSTVVAAVVGWKCRHHFRCRKVKGKYISVYQKEVDEEIARIELEEAEPYADD